MKCRHTRTLAAAAALGLLAGAAGAHHSTAAFDNGRVIKIEGQVQTMQLRNPHSWIKLEGPAEDAASGEAFPEGLWTVEMTARNVLINGGWTNSSVRAGDTITVYANPLRNPVELNDGSQGALYIGVVTADGESLGRTDGQGEGSAE